jgi:hypothetical protein
MVRTARLEQFLQLRHVLEDVAPIVEEYEPLPHCVQVLAREAPKDEEYSPPPQ